MRFKGNDFHGVDGQLPAQIGQKAALGIGLLAIGIAHAHRHFVGQLAVAGLNQLLHRGLDLHAPEQHVLVQP